MYRAGFVQFCPVRGNVERNIAQVRGLLAGREADLLVLPELANSGYIYARPADLAPCAEPADGRGPYLSALRELAGATGALLVSGFAEQAAEGLYNSAAAVDAQGVVAVYRKTHLFADEQDLFLPGDTGFWVIEHRGVHIGVMICYDWLFPESARTLALAGAQIIAHPANLVTPYCQNSMVTRSLENAVFTITANRFGTETLPGKTLTFTGSSQVLDPRGNRLSQAPVEGHCMAFVPIDPTAADNKWFTPRNNIFEERRPRFYGLM